MSSPAERRDRRAQQLPWAMGAHLECIGSPVVTANRRTRRFVAARSIQCVESFEYFVGTVSRTQRTDSSGRQANVRTFFANGVSLQRRERRHEHAESRVGIPAPA